MNSSERAVTTIPIRRSDFQGHGGVGGGASSAASTTQRAQYYASGGSFSIPIFHLLSFNLGQLFHVCQIRLYDNLFKHTIIRTHN
jgi:hypothetical protein